MKGDFRTNDILDPINAVERIRINDIVQPKAFLKAYKNSHIRLAARCVEQFGFLNPPLLNQRNEILAGVIWYLAARKLEIPAIPVMRVTHLSDTQARVYQITEQRILETVSWDDRALADELLSLSTEDLDFDLELTGFSWGEIESRIANLDDILPDDDNAVAPVPMSGPPRTQLGDLWVLGRHRILCGSALDAENWSSLMEDTRANLVFTDPPYNVPVHGHVTGKGKIKHREFGMAVGEMSSNQFKGFLEDTLRLAAQHSKGGSVHYICMDWRHIADLLLVGSAVYDSLLNVCIWVKANGGMGSFYRSRHEMVAVFRHGAKAHINNIELGAHGRNRTNVWEYAGTNSFSGRATDEGRLSDIHPTVKPVQMVADAILDASRRGDIVVDPFLGSGTTLIAAERVHRRCFGMELDPVYVDQIVQRWQKHTGLKAIHSRSGIAFDDAAADSETP